MSFRFNFSSTSDYEVTCSHNLTSSQNEVVSNTSNKTYLKNCEFLILSEDSLKCTTEAISLLRIGDFELKYVLVDSIKMTTEDETFSQISTLETDLIPGKYEGGLKIWECSIDLANYVSEHTCFKSGDTVLELGCGAGLPGLIAYLKGASVTFQDYNTEVLKHSTIPNTVLNTTPNEVSTIPEICHYLYGDWGSIHEKYYCNQVSQTKYDFILTSETIYEKENQKKLLELMKSALKPGGTIYLAAKIFYFGVGGGITDFEALVNSDKTFEISSVHRITGGVERQILVMKFR